MKSLSIIIPTYNDAKKIKSKIHILIKKLQKTKLKYEIIIVNDGSKDGTKSEIKKISKKYKLILINNDINQGKSYSINKGLKKSKHQNIILTDSDLPYFSSFNKIIKKLDKNYDFVFVNRRHKKSKIINRKLNFYQISRYFIGYVVSLVVRLALNMNIYGGDTQSGLKGFKKIKNFKKFKFVSSKFFLDLEIMYCYKKLNKKFYSIPVKYKIDDKSSIKIFSLKKNFDIIIELFKVILILKNKSFF